MPFDIAGLRERDLTQEERDDLMLLQVTIDNLRKPNAWAKGMMKAAERRCALGWLYAVAGVNNRDTRRRIDGLIERRLLREIPDEYCCTDYLDHQGQPIGWADSLMRFNDSKSSPEPVIAAFQRAADRILLGV